jgi:hypothetical protein
VTNDKILFVTSFNEELFKASGERLLNSFLEAGQVATGTMLCCVEGLRPGPDPREGVGLYLGRPGLRFYDLEHDEFLQDWLAANKDVIPDYLGGEAKECRCPGRQERHAKHQKFGCHWQWMNRNASRWFRKVASLRAAVQAGEDFRYMVWLDADAYLRQRLPVAYVAEKLKRAGMFYFRGHRPAVESGVLGFDLAGTGDLFVAALCHRYESRDYRKYERWDDGFQIAQLVDERPDLKTVDLVHPTRHKNVTNDVIPTTDIDAYVRHEKGRHGTKLNIMK